MMPEDAVRQRQSDRQPGRGRREVDVDIHAHLLI